MFMNNMRLKAGLVLLFLLPGTRGGRGVGGTSSFLNGVVTVFLRDISKNCAHILRYNISGTRL